MVAKGGWWGGWAALSLFLLPCPGLSFVAAMPWVLVPISISIPCSSAQLLAFESNPFPSICRLAGGNSQSHPLCKISSQGDCGTFVCSGRFQTFPWHPVGWP